MHIAEAQPAQTPDPGKPDSTTPGRFVSLYISAEKAFYISVLSQVTDPDLRPRIQISQ